jgi:hypothetical protein
VGEAPDMTELIDGVQPVHDDTRGPATMVLASHGISFVGEARDGHARA